MENDRREDPQPEAVSPQPEAPAYREAEERREDYAGEDQPREYRDDAPDPGAEGATFDSEGRQTEGAPGAEIQPAAGAPGGQGPQDRDRGGRGRSGRRGGRRMSQRERRQDRNRRRDHRPGFSSSHHGGSGGGGYQQQHSAGQPSHQRDQGAEPLRESQPRPEGSGSILNDVRAEVERLREVLEGVLRDLEDVAEQLIKAEHEKDLAEAEIEQLRDQLRRLHR